MNQTAKNTQFIRNLALELGFSEIGFSKAEYMEIEAKRLDQWLNNNHHGKMSYLENHFDLRVDPTKLVPGAKSVISLMYNYHTDKKQSDSNAPKVSKYAYGRDYHKVVRKKLNTLIKTIRNQIGDIEGRCFVDSAPIMEKDWAKRSGIGWIGKNTLLINPKKGSVFFLAELILDLELDYDVPIKDLCGSCTKCIDACPTDAIEEEGFVLDAKKCISYLTIELKENIPEEFAGKMENWMFGCDICQDVCPWNRFSVQHKEPDFEPKVRFLNQTKEEWHEITEEVFDEMFFGSPIKRTQYSGLKRNLKFIKK